MGVKIKVKTPKVVKKIGKALKNPVNWTGIGALTNLGLGALGLNSITPQIAIQMGIYGGMGFLMGGPVGAAAGAGLAAAQAGTLGRNIQDIATMGASAQIRYNQQMYNAYNAAQKQQAKINELNNEQNLLQQIRAARIARSMNLADYASETGVVSSGALGNLGSIGSQYLSGVTYSYLTGKYANAYQTYMNQYNWYQTQAKNSEIRWNNRINTLNTALSLYGSYQSLKTGALQNQLLEMKVADAWSDVGKAQQGSSKIPTSWTGFMGYSWNA